METERRFDGGHSLAVPWLQRALGQPVTRAPKRVADRVATVDADQLRRDAPEMFAAWERGVLRPFWLTIELDRHRFGGAWVDETVGVSEPVIDLVEAGAIYPSWELVCRLAALVDAPLERLLIEDPEREQGHGGRCGSAFLARVMRARYDPTVVAATVSGDAAALDAEAVRHRYETVQREATVKMLSEMGVPADLIEQVRSGAARLR